MAYAALAVLLMATAPLAGASGVNAQPALPQSSTIVSPQAAVGSGPSTIDTQTRQGIEAYRQRNYEGALRIFRQVIAADPNNILAYNMAGNCSMNLKDYSSAIDSFSRALSLRPDEWHNLSGLIRAYTLAGKPQERDEARRHIIALEQEGKLPPTFNYVFETFELDGRRIEVSEFLQIQGYYGERYRFNVFNSDGKQISSVILESDALEQPGWARSHPKEAAAGPAGILLRRVHQ
jgi:tetratricopeptide (TPR) repeat protein